MPRQSIHIHSEMNLSSIYFTNELMSKGNWVHWILFNGIREKRGDHQGTHLSEPNL